MAKAYWDRYYYETFFKENFLDSCLVLVNIALSLDDRLEEAYYLKGRYYYEKNNFEEAVINYDKALKINHNYADAYGEKAWTILARLGDLINGLDNYHRAGKVMNYYFKTQPDKPQFPYNILNFNSIVIVKSWG
jgi:tetratricopeptide (TPR) repeat protein